MRPEDGGVSDPTQIIDRFWHGANAITVTRADLKAVYLYYGADFLHMRAGVGYHLKNRRVGPGLYELYLEAVYP